MYLVLGAGLAITMFLTSWMYGLSGESLTMRLRNKLFRALLRQDMSFYDNPKHSTGALTTRLATDASAVQGATGTRIGMILQAMSTMTCSLIIGFVFSWKFALFILGCLPFILLSAIMQMKISKGLSGKRNKDLEEAGKIAAESISNIRTVASLSREDKFLDEYKRLIEPQHRFNMKLANVFGITFSFVEAMKFFCYAGIFYFGAWLICYDRLSYDSMFKVFGAIVMGAVSLGRESQLAPNYGKARFAAARIFALLELQPKVDNYDSSGKQPEDCAGKVEFKGSEFSYPNRATVKVLKGINLSVEKGQTVALVGSSGCGKSTTVQLLERLYDVSAGQVMVDGVDVRELNIAWLRNQLGIVSQEPVLFDCSIRENIEYGDNSRQVTMDEVIAASRLANIHQFIEALPDGYETRVGDKGTQLSGGQKQRIAIARALVRNPKILLLDEATSALDTESEKIVQEALDRAQQGRTCLVIAHRLSTIQNADCIIVFHNGRVAEQGTHSELLAQRGLYYKLQQAQARKI
jgi:ATP-binding cassette subfamily B (MDR/TAP) protein 1